MQLKTKPLAIAGAALGAMLLAAGAAAANEGQITLWASQNKIYAEPVEQVPGGPVCPDDLRLRMIQFDQQFDTMRAGQFPPKHSPRKIAVRRAGQKVIDTNQSGRTHRILQAPDNQKERSVDLQLGVELLGCERFGFFELLSGRISVSGQIEDYRLTYETRLTDKSRGSVFVNWVLPPAGTEPRARVRVERRTDSPADDREANGSRQNSRVDESDVATIRALRLAVFDDVIAAVHQSTGAELTGKLTIMMGDHDVTFLEDTP